MGSAAQWNRIRAQRSGATMRASRHRPPVIHWFSRPRYADTSKPRRKATPSVCWRSAVSHRTWCLRTPVEAWQRRPSSAASS